MKSLLSAIIALMVLTGVTGSASAFDCDDDYSVDEIYSTGEGR